MPGYLDRALLLYQQGRYLPASLELRRAIADEPDDPHAHALLGVCLSHLGDAPDATRAAHESLALAPDYAFGHYAYAFVLARQGRTFEAGAAILRAIAIDNGDAEYFHLLAQIRHAERNWRGALEAADRGLRVQGDHVGCSNSRSQAEIKMGRRTDALGSVDAALRLEPDNPHTHATKGWTLLEANELGIALEHFREALRLDPTMDWAREGYLVATKARFPIYRVVLNGLLAAGRHRALVTGICIALFVVIRGVALFVPTHSAGTAWLECVVGLLGLIGFAAWTADPLCNTFLRIKSGSCSLLTSDQLVESNYVSGIAAFGVLALCVFALHRRDGWLGLGLGSLTLAMGVALILKRLPQLGGVMTGVLTAVFGFLMFCCAAQSGL